CNQGFKNLVCSAHIINKYLYWFLKDKTDYLNSLGRGATFKEISKAIVQSIELPLPPLDEQKRIAKNLDLASEIAKGYKEQLAELDKLVQSVFYEMFGDPVTNEKGWEMQSLQSVCDVRDGTHDSPAYVAEGYPLVTSKNVSQGYIDFFTTNLISQKDLIKINQRSKVDKGDIIMPMIGTIGNPVIVNVDREFAVKNVAIIKFAGSIMCNIFIKTLLSSSFFENATQKANRGGTQKFIALGDIRKLSIPIPPSDVQTRFASIVTEIESQKEQVQKALTEAENLFNSLMQEYFE
ncbi:MAG: restriction endonuclease subunit S, partial [Oscillospiraceae bacterium]|nr:restriction endonuclease subunit S [Oscillospiraceae bacterium]